MLTFFLYKTNNLSNADKPQKYDLSAENRSLLYLELQISIIVLYFSWVPHVSELLPSVAFRGTTWLLVSATALPHPLPSSRLHLRLRLRLEHAQVCKYRLCFFNLVLYMFGVVFTWFGCIFLRFNDGKLHWSLFLYYIKKNMEVSEISTSNINASLSMEAYQGCYEHLSVRHWV